jgi:hypothetical protein
MNCQAIIEDYENGTRNNLRRVTISPMERSCKRSAIVQLGALCLCTQHGKLAAEGLVDKSGQVAPRGDLRAVRDNPQHFPNGLHHWAQGLKLVKIDSRQTTPAAEIRHAVKLTEAQTKTAIQLLMYEAVGGGCSYLMSRKFKGGTCAEENGRGSSCSHCATVDFLKSIGVEVRR